MYNKVRLTLWEDLTVAFFGFLLGLISGVVIQSLKFKHDRKLDKIRRLMPYMEIVHPIVETLLIDVEHGLKLQEKDDLPELDRYLIRVADAFSPFAEWYSDFVERGMKAELQSLEYELFAGLYGIFVYYQLTKIHGVETISQNLKEIGANLKKTISMLEEFLKQ